MLWLLDSQQLNNTDNVIFFFFNIDRKVGGKHMKNIQSKTNTPDKQMFYQLRVAPN